jgi:hypothetical protein
MGVATMLIFYQYFRGWHMGYFTPPLKEVLVEK